jgi:hypothetical protein
LREEPQAFPNLGDDALRRRSLSSIEKHADRVPRTATSSDDDGGLTVPRFGDRRLTDRVEWPRLNTGSRPGPVGVPDDDDPTIRNQQPRRVPCQLGDDLFTRFAPIATTVGINL